MARTRQARPDSGLGFQIYFLKIVRVVPSLLGSEQNSWALHAPQGELQPHLHPAEVPLSSEEGTTYKILSTFGQTPRPESGLDCLTCATFAHP